MRVEDLLSIADMPARPGIFQQPRRQRSVAQRNQKNDEDEICDGGYEQSKPGRECANLGFPRPAAFNGLRWSSDQVAGLELEGIS